MSLRVAQSLLQVCTVLLCMYAMADCASAAKVRGMPLQEKYYNITAAVMYADRTWNCDGSAPPCPGCKTVPGRSWQDPYGCAPYVAHCLAAGGIVPKPLCGSMGDYSAVEHDGKSYDLNVVGSKDPNCDGLCLTDFLLAKGWIVIEKEHVKAGTVCAVVGDTDWGHVVFGVEFQKVGAYIRRHRSCRDHIGVSWSLIFPAVGALKPSLRRGLPRAAEPEHKPYYSVGLKFMQAYPSLLHFLPVNLL